MVKTDQLQQVLAQHAAQQQQQQQSVAAVPTSMASVPAAALPYETTAFMRESVAIGAAVTRLTRRRTAPTATPYYAQASELAPYATQGGAAAAAVAGAPYGSALPLVPVSVAGNVPYATQQQSVPGAAYAVPAAAAPVTMAAAQAALLRQVAQLTPQEINMLPPEQRDKVLLIRRQLNLQ
jgi:hypothetical protein